MTSITNHDKFVINAIFNPNYPLDFDNLLPLDSTILSQNNGKFFIYIRITNCHLVQAIEVKRLEEEGKFDIFSRGNYFYIDFDYLRSSTCRTKSSY